MDIIEALKTAIAFEKKVASMYSEALEKTADPVGRRIFGLMADEEAHHVSYLESKLRACEAGGSLSSSDLDTRVPSAQKITAAANLGQKLGAVDPGSELERLQRAREVELETSGFYRRMVDELADDGKTLFARFVEIEDGHLALVEAEIEHLQHRGAWMSADDGELRFF